MFLAGALFAAIVLVTACCCATWPAVKTRFFKVSVKAMAATLRLVKSAWNDFAAYVLANET